MKKVTRNILLALALVGLLVLLGLASSVYYLKTHPSSLKPFLERVLSRVTGASLSMEYLNWSLKPLEFSARGIRLTSGEKLRGLDLEVPNLSAALSLEGTLGQRRLILRELRVEGFRLAFTQDLRLPEFTSEGPPPGPFAAILQRLIYYFLFSEFEFRVADVSDGHVIGRMGDREIEVSDIRGAFKPGNLVEISCGARIEDPLRGIRFVVPGFQFETDRGISFADPTITGRLEIRGSTLQSPQMEFRSADWDVSLTYRHSQKKLVFGPMDLDLQGLLPKRILPYSLSPVNVHLKGEGTLDLQGLSANLSSFQVDLGDVAGLQGRLQAALDPRVDVLIHIEKGHLLPEKVLPILPREILKGMPPATLSGPISVSGDIHGWLEGMTWETDCDLRAGLLKNAFSYEGNGIALHGEITGDARAGGRFPDVKADARMEIHGIVLKGPRIRTKPFDVEGSLAWDNPSLHIKDVTLHTPEALLTVIGPETPVTDIRVYVPEGILDVEKRSLDLPRFEVHSSLLQNLSFSTEASEKKIHLSLMGEKTDLMGALRTLNLVPPGWKIAGTDNMWVEVLQEGGREWSVKTRLAFRGLSLENADGSYTGEGLSLDVGITGTVSPDLSRVEADTSIEMKEGELLADRFYFDLTQSPFLATARGIYSSPERILNLSRATLSLKDLLGVEIAGTLGPENRALRADLTLRVSETPIKPLFKHLVVEPFKANKPLLADMEVIGDLSGEIALALRGTRMEAKGRMMWQEGALSLNEKGLALRGVNLDLPLWARSPSDDVREEPLMGRFRIRSLLLPPLPDQDLDLLLSVTPNTLWLKEPTHVKVPGGEIDLGPLVCRGLFFSKPTLETSVTLKALDLNPHLSKIWSHKIEGSIEGRLDPIRYAGDTLTSRGQLKAGVFGGSVVISDLGASGLLAAAPLLRGNAKWDDLQLAELTRDTAFGKVEGILRGHIKDLEIAYGQPQHFDLLLETVKTKGVPQRISVLAVDNIARIGGGQSPFMGLAGVVTSFFKEFPYERIGVRASLENDVFRVNGTITEEDREYLVKRSSFSGVNVVNQNPDNRIRFKDMVKRIKRITTSKKGPVLE